MRLALLSSLTLLFGCPNVSTDTGVKPGEDSDSAGGGGDTSAGDSEDTDVVIETGDTDPGTPDLVDGTLSGTITLQLYTTDDAGDVTYLDWTEAYGAYPFGQVFVAVYNDDETTGVTSYYATQAIVPNADGTVDPYSIQVHVDDVASVHVYAAVDWYVDGVIGTYEPVGRYIDAVEVSDGSTVGDLDITVLVPYTGGGGGGGGGGGEICETTMGGDLTVDGYTSGAAAALVYDLDNQGPYYTGVVTPGEEPVPWMIGACTGGSDGILLGAWDSNNNGLFDPADTWGTYVADGADGNPIVYGLDTLTGYDIEIPYGIDTPRIVADVPVTGLITVLGDLATSPPSEAVTYVVASRTRPGADFDLNDKSNWWDRSTFDATKMAEGSFDYRLSVPANTVAYLWAFIDLDGDGIVNEVGEPVGAAFNLSGQFSTGRTAWTDVDFFLADPDSTGG